MTLQQDSADRLSLWINLKAEAVTPFDGVLGGRCLQELIESAFDLDLLVGVQRKREANLVTVKPGYFHGRATRFLPDVLHVPITGY